MYAAFEWLGVTTFNLKKRQEILNAYKKKKEKKKSTSLLRKFSEMQNILQSRPVTKYRLNLVARFFLEPKIHLACSDTLSYAPHHLI